MAGRSRLRAAGLLLLALVVVLAGLMGWRVLRPDTYVAPTPTSTAAVADPEQATRALQRLSSALDDHDAARAAALSGDVAGRTLLGAVGHNAALLRVSGVTARFVQQTGAVTSTGAWQADVYLTWRFDGFDAHPVREEVLVGFRTAGGRTVITSLGGGDLRSPLWLAGPVTVRRTPQTLVLVAGDSPAAARSAGALARLAGRAVPAVHQVVHDWRARLVVEVPGSEAQLDRILATPVGTYTNIAAVTSTVNGSSAAQAPIHVFVNPEVFSSLEPRGAQIVLTHESTHVALRAPLSTHLPTWLVEGFADFVALRHVPLPLTTTAGQIIAQVRRHGPPTHLPDQADFAAQAPHLGATYEAAWLACRLLAGRTDARTLLAVYRQVDAGASLDTVLRRLTGLDTATLTRQWRAELTALAARSTGHGGSGPAGGTGTLAR